MTNIIPEALNHWLNDKHPGKFSFNPMSGGCISTAGRVNCADGRSYFLKVNTSSPTDMFFREAEGLTALSVEKGPYVPKPIIVDETYILLEDLNSAPRRNDYWEDFGIRLACLHQINHHQFGFGSDNYIGSTEQVNDWMDDGFEFFGTNRILYQARLAYDNGYLIEEDIKQIEKIISRLRSLIPDQPASLLHGDLWSGNAIANNHGRPALIDPAVHYGWAEAELAMTALFGRFPQIFYSAYSSTRVLHRGYEERFDLYNLYHLINHLNLFGTGYLQSVRAILNKYS